MSATVLRILAGLFALPALAFASLTFMAPRSSLSDAAAIYPFWLVPALLLVTVAGFWWTMPMRKLVPIVMVLPIILWSLAFGLVIAIGYLAG